MKRLSEQSLYEILEVPPDAAATDIESAYTRARDLYAPGSLATYSLMPPEEAAAMAERIEEAKRVLLDPDARARYDATLVAATGAAESAVRIAATGTGAVAAGPQRPYLVPPLAPSRTPSPPPRSVETPKTEPAVEEETGEKAAPEEPKGHSAEAKGTPGVVVEPPPAAAAGPILLQKEIPAEPASREIHVPEGAVWTGEALRRVREGRGFTVRELCDRTKITRYHLENIEGERFTLLPAPVYLRGILLAVARELRLDGQKVARSYLERMATAGSGPR